MNPGMHALALERSIEMRGTMDSPGGRELAVRRNGSRIESTRRWVPSRWFWRPSTRRRRGGDGTGDRQSATVVGI